MTVGNLFLIALFIGILILITGYITYRCILRSLNKKGYKYPEEEVSLSTVVFLTALTFVGIGIIFLLLYKIIVNWNTVI